MPSWISRASRIRSSTVARRRTSSNSMAEASRGPDCSITLRQLRSDAGGTATVAGLYTLGFSSVFREGFETVLFLQALQLEAGTGIVLAGVSLGLAAVAVVGVLTFKLEQRLPYKRMLVVTGVMPAAPER